MLQTAMRKVAPTVVASWPRYHGVDEIIEGAARRRNNVSALWAWLGGYDVNRSYVGQLFGDVQLTVMPQEIAQTAVQLTNLIGTLSMYSRLTERQRNDLAYEYELIYKKLGRPIRSSTVCVVVTAKRGS